MTTVEPSRTRERTGPARIAGTAAAPEDHIGRLRQLGVDSAYLLIGFPLALVGFVLLVVRALALGQARFSRVLLTGLARLRSQIAGLQVSAETARAATRAAASAEATALRRLERDIHDGPQQRLVRIAVDLGRAHEPH